MRRLLLCLPLCFILAPDSLGPRPESGAEDCSVRSEEKVRSVEAVVDNGEALPDNAAMAGLIQTDPVAFLENCLRRYDRTVTGYRMTMRNQERVGGELQKTELIEASFREKPFSVLLVWKEGARRAQRTLYVQGENDNQMLVRPTGLASLLVVARDPLGADVRASSRYSPLDFGLRITTQKTLQAWKDARARGDLEITFKGEKCVPEAGNRLCWVVERTGYTRPEEDGIRHATFYIDQETWFQVGTVLRRGDGGLLGEYFFRDIEVNPTFDDATFTRKAL